jgi:hypothetical protein
VKNDKEGREKSKSHLKKEKKKRKEMEKKECKAKESEAKGIIRISVYFTYSYDFLQQQIILMSVPRHEIPKISL